MRPWILMVCALGTAFAAKYPQLASVHNVYLLPMGASLDQYLATRLTESGLFQVVTDPQKADAIITDKIGEPFEQKMEDLYPPPKPDTKDKDKDKDTAKDDDQKKDEDQKKDDLLAKPYQRFGSFSKGRGTVYIVDRQSRNVVWSIYWPVKTTRPDDTHKRANQIIERLRKDIQGK